MEEGTGEIVINRSSDFQNQLDKVKVLPQETEKQKAEKLRSARLLRMKALLANAELNHRLSGLISTGREVDTNLFLTEGVADNIIHPEQTAEIAFALEEAKRLSTKYFDLFKERASGDLKKAGEFLFRSMTGKDPAGVVYINASFRYALTLTVNNQEDFKIIDARENVGGFFMAKREARDSLTGEVEHYPLIVVLGSGFTPTLLHEETHSVNFPVQEGLDKSGRVLVWARTDNGSIGENIVRLFNETDIEKAKQREEFKNVLSWAYGLVKDEYLAQLSEGYHKKDGTQLTPDIMGVFDYPNLHFLREQGGIYDYFLRLCPKDSPLYKILWEEYDKMLQKVETDFIKKPAEVYSGLGLNLRHYFFRGVLLQFPLEDWQRQLKECLFEEELQRLQGIYEKYRNLPKIYVLRRYFVRKDLEELRFFISQNPTEPIFDLIEKTEKHLGIRFKPIEEQRISHKKKE